MTTAFGVYSTAHGSLIVNRFDYNRTYEDKWYGVGAQLLETGAYDQSEVEMLKQLLGEKRKLAGDHVLVMDCGANIGVFTVEFAKFMRGWGKVLAIEAQEWLFYALGGNLAINNCFNAKAIWGAVDEKTGHIDIPEPNYCTPSSFGSFELREALGNENIGQDIDYSKKTSRVNAMRIDDFGLSRLDLLKLDVEGMEMDALAGAIETIKRCKPMIFIEIMKIDREKLGEWLDGLGYKVFSHGVMNVLAVHKDDPVISCIQTEEVPA